VGGIRERGAQIEGWDYLLTVPARGDSIYQTVVGTLCDATKPTPCANAFFVSAMTPDPMVFFDSEADTGFSVDDLPPGPPFELLAADEGTAVRLTWTAPEDPDVESYRVYRGSDADFAPTASHLLAETVDTEWRDVGGSLDYHYKVTTMDDGGNESEPAEASPPTPAKSPIAFSLAQNVPNPFNPATVIPYTVGEGGGWVTLSVYDVAGRLVITLVDEAQTGGDRAVEWDGRDRQGAPVSSGTYFYRLTGPGFEQTRKMTLVQ
jgi:hypothetical protein